MLLKWGHARGVSLFYRWKRGVYLTKPVIGPTITHIAAYDLVDALELPTCGLVGQRGETGQVQCAE